MADVEIAQGDFGRESAVVVSLRKASNALYVPELGSTVTITLSRRGDGYAFTRACTVQDDKVTWTPAEGDTDEPGLYDVQWTITNPDDEPLTLPTCTGATSRYAFTIEICGRP